MFYKNPYTATGQEFLDIEQRNIRNIICLFLFVLLLLIGKLVHTIRTGAGPYPCQEIGISPLKVNGAYSGIGRRQRIRSMRLFSHSEGRPKAQNW